MKPQEVLSRHRVVVCVGCGGVGKTTTAASLALHAALQGRRTLCLTIDPARRLANSLGLSEMTTEEQLVPEALFEQAGLTCKGTLSAMMLDTKQTFDDLVIRHASTPEIRDRILNNTLYKYVSTSLAGTQEYMAMEKLHAVREASDYDLIVLDTPPTTNALDFLEAPEKLVQAIDSAAMRWFLQAFTGAGKLGFGLLSKGANMVLKGLSRFTGGDFLTAMAEFITDLNDLFGGFTERANEVSSALRSDEVAFVLVTSADPLAIREADFFAQKLAEADMQQRMTVVNRITPLLPEPNGSREDLLDVLRLDSPDIDAEPLLEKLWGALDEERTRAVNDRVEVERLRGMTRIRAGHGPEGYIEVPAMDQDVHDLHSLARVATHLMASEG